MANQNPPEETDQSQEGQVQTERVVSLEEVNQLHGKIHEQVTIIMDNSNIGRSTLREDFPAGSEIKQALMAKKTKAYWEDLLNEACDIITKLDEANSMARQKFSAIQDNCKRLDSLIEDFEYRHED
jgi:hypothetical protein